MIWVTGYVVGVAFVVAVGVSRDARKQRARNRQAEFARGEVESVPVHGSICDRAGGARP